MLKHISRSSAILSLLGGLALVVSTSTSAAVPPSTTASPPGRTPPPPLASAQSNGTDDRITNATAEVIDINRSDSSNLTSVTVKVTNDDSDNIHDKWFGHPVYIYREDVFSGVRIFDKSENSRHSPIMDEKSYCSCSGYAPRAPYMPYVWPGGSVDYWAMYSLPADTNEVTVEIPGFDPIEDVPVR